MLKSFPIFNITGTKSAAFIILFIFLSGAVFSQSKVVAVKGILDLRNQDWEKNGIIDLNGEWEFYWNILYSPSSFDSAPIKPLKYSIVPGFWNKDVPKIGLFDPAFGFATYRLKILCAKSNEKLDLKFLTVASAYKLYVNGKQILEIGKVGTNRSTTTPAYLPVIVPVLPENNELNLVIQVANFNYSTGGLWDFIKLGTHDKIYTFWLRNVSIDSFIAGSFFLMGIYYFVIYFFFRRRKASLYFSVFCILVAMRPLITDQLVINYVANWSWQFIRHAEFISLYLTVPFLSLFSYELFPKEFSKKVLRYILMISIPFAVAAVFTSPFIFRYTLRPFQVYMLLTALYGLYVYIKAVQNKRPGSGYLLTGFIILFLTIINDLLYTSLVIESMNLIYAGLFIFIVSQAIALSKQFFWTFTKLEEVNHQLEQKNDELKEKNDAINEANDELTKLNAELDILVFRASHDLRSPITSIVALVHIIKEEKDENKRNIYLDLQGKTLQRLNSLITDIIEFSKNKRTELNYQAIDFHELIDSALEDHIFSENSTNIKRIVEIDQQGIFITDRSRINMVIINLISNALKYHDTGHDDPYLKITIKTVNNYAEIIVEDNGQGIGEKHIGLIFTMFYRANSMSGGSGIGLYIVKEAIEKLGGTIRVESQINIGTKFLIVIPNHLDN